ncbi:MAG: DUF4446 family protein [Anaerolineae bacterium]|nr:DUF4446 family protein [Anaerolineae bacterium]
MTDTFTFDPYWPYLALAGLLLALVGLAWAFTLQRRLTRLETLRRQVLASGGPDLETLLQANLTRLDTADERLDALSGDLTALIERQKRDLQHVGIIRFNPYQDTGGDQSFSIALLDSYGDGVVISGLYARQGVRLYAKPVQAGQSSYPLTDEEKQAMAVAHRQRA